MSLRVMLISVAASSLVCFTLGYNVASGKHSRLALEAESASKEALLRAVEQARKEERDSASYLSLVDQTTQENLRAIIKNQDATISDLRAGALQLRQRFTCPSTDVRGPAPTPSGGDAASGGGLRESDAEFLVRIAAEADTVTALLRGAQATIREYYARCGPPQ